MHHLRFILLLAASMPLLSFAQKQGQERIDSLVALLPAMADDSMKVKLLEEISYSYYNIDPNHGVEYGERSLELAKQLGWEQGMAQAYNTIGINYGYGKADHPNALANYLKSLALRERMGDRMQVAGLLNNIGSVYDEQGDDQKALEYYERALAINRELGNTDWMANNLSNIGVVHTRLKQFDKAITYKREALKLKEQLGNQWGVATNTTQLARIYGEMGKLDTAIVLFNTALPIYRELGDRNGEAKVLSQLGTAHLHLAKERPAQRRELLEEALLLTDSSLSIYREVGHLQFIGEGYRGRSEIKHELGDDGGALDDLRSAETYKDSVFNLEKDKKLVQQAMQYEFDKKEAVSAEEIRRKGLQRNALLGFGVLGIVFAVVDMRRRRRIKQEHARSEALLLNILPAEVASELKAKGAAEAKHFDTATILFTDFKGFTEASEKLTPQELVAELNTCFKAFDNMITARGIEKIKTIGDAYMYAGGLPDPKTSSPADVVHAALEMQAFMIARKKERDARGLPAFEMRVGIHTGPVVAGIVGVKKFQYDIWGDTVNTASRMESSGEVGQVNISEATWALVKNDGGLSFTPRGKVQAKGKGEMEMYFVERAPIEG